MAVSAQAQDYASTMATTLPPAAPAASRPVLTSLRARLIASHLFVLLLALALVFAISAAFLRRYERSAEIDRLRDLAVPLTIQTGVLVHPNRPLTDLERRNIANLLYYEAAEEDVRLLVFYPDATVLFDTAETGNLAGQTLSAYAPSIAAVSRQAQRGGAVQHLVAQRAGAGTDPLAGDRLIVAAGGRKVRGQPRVVFGIVAPPRRLPLLRLYLPRLLLVLAASLAIASGAGYILSRRIAAPVDRLTAAANAMAEGQLEQRVPGEGPDELGRLVASFNAMSHQVAATARSQRDFLANVAHELRTPLTSVQGYTQALRDGVVEDAAEQERALATIGVEAERMASLIRQLLDLARLESGQAKLTLRPVELSPLLDQVAARFGPEAERRRVEVVAAAPRGLRVRGDEERLAQIVSNLVGNALRHTPAGGQIAMAAAPVSGRPAVRLTVRDTGVGIPPERLPTIFDRFQRGDDRGEGFGLGLAIVRELVQAHGGAVDVQSQVGVGTTFSVELPAAA